MNAREIIANRIKGWRQVNAGDFADETFQDLDADEVIRIAHRGWVEEIRAELRSKDADGVPRYASIEITDSGGDKARLYKQTALFSAEDFRLAVDYHRREAVHHLITAKALAKRCNEIHGTQLEIPELETGT